MKKMKVSELCLSEDFKEICLPDGEREIEGVYIGDLLSWVMGRAESGNAWITIMSNINTIAVATLADTSVIILSEGVALENEVLQAAASKGINVVSTKLTSYQAALRLSELI